MQSRLPVWVVQFARSDVSTRLCPLAHCCAEDAQIATTKTAVMLLAAVHQTGFLEDSFYTSASRQL